MGVAGAKIFSPTSHPAFWPILFALIFTALRLDFVFFHGYFDANNCNSPFLWSFGRIALWAILLVSAACFGWVFAARGQAGVLSTAKRVVRPVLIGAVLAMALSILISYALSSTMFHQTYDSYSPGGPKAAVCAACISLYGYAHGCCSLYFCFCSIVHFLPDLFVAVLGSLIGAWLAGLQKSRSA
ncbi:Uncharacterised protein [uncultured archaeon]|nr:Uncharacterised protein [uncultured archaeon]